MSSRNRWSGSSPPTNNQPSSVFDIPRSSTFDNNGTPSFQTNVNRSKTRRWVEAKPAVYDGDDWGVPEYDDEDVENEQDYDQNDGYRNDDYRDGNSNRLQSSVHNHGKLHPDEMQDRGRSGLADSDNDRVPVVAGTVVSLADGQNGDWVPVDDKAGVSAPGLTPPERWIPGSDGRVVRTGASGDGNVGDGTAMSMSQQQQHQPLAPSSPPNNQSTPARQIRGATTSSTPSPRGTSSRPVSPSKLRHVYTAPIEPDEDEDGGNHVDDKDKGRARVSRLERDDPIAALAAKLEAAQAADAVEAKRKSTGPAEPTSPVNSSARTRVRGIADEWEKRSTGSPSPERSAVPTSIASKSGLEGAVADLAGDNMVKKIDRSAPPDRPAYPSTLVDLPEEKVVAEPVTTQDKTTDTKRVSRVQTAISSLSEQSTGLSSVSESRFMSAISLASPVAPTTTERKADETDRFASAVGSWESTPTALIAARQTEPTAGPGLSVDRPSLTRKFSWEADTPPLQSVSRVDQAPNEPAFVPEPQTKFEVHHAVEPWMPAQTERQPEFTAEPKFVSEPMTQAGIEPMILPKIEPQTEPEVEPTSEPDIDRWAEPRDAPKSEAVADSHTEPKVDFTFEPTFEPKLGLQPDSTVEPKLEPGSGSTDTQTRQFEPTTAVSPVQPESSWSSIQIPPSTRSTQPKTEVGSSQRDAQVSATRQDNVPNKSPPGYTISIARPSQGLDSVSRLPTFREMLAIRVTSDRIQTLHGARVQFAAVDTGLASWVNGALAQQAAKGRPKSDFLPSARTTGSSGAPLSLESAGRITSWGAGLKHGTSVSMAIPRFNLKSGLHLGRLAGSSTSATSAAPPKPAEESKEHSNDMVPITVLDGSNRTQFEKGKERSKVIFSSATKGAKDLFSRSKIRFRAQDG